MNGLTIPLSATLKIFRPRANARTNTDVEVMVEYILKSTNVGYGVQLSAFQPVIPGTTAIDDYRDGYLAYVSRDRWPSIEELRTSGYSQTFKSVNARSTGVKSKLGHSVVRTIVGVIILLPILLYWFFARRN